MKKDNPVLPATILLVAPDTTMEPAVHATVSLSVALNTRLCDQPCTDQSELTSILVTTELFRAKEEPKKSHRGAKEQQKSITPQTQ